MGGLVGGGVQGDPITVVSTFYMLSLLIYPALAIACLVCGRSVVAHRMEAGRLRFEGGRASRASCLRRLATAS